MYNPTFYKMNLRNVVLFAVEKTPRCRKMRPLFLELLAQRDECQKHLLPNRLR